MLTHGANTEVKAEFRRQFLIRFEPSLEVHYLQVFCRRTHKHNETPTLPYKHFLNVNILKEGILTVEAHKYCVSLQLSNVNCIDLIAR